MRATLALLLLACAWPGAAQALRCDGRVVSAGDHAFELRSRCGEPFWIERYSEVLIAGEQGPLEQRIERPVEAWYYNFGPNQLMRRMLLVDDRLVREDTLGYGYRRLGEDCRLDQLAPGLSNAEIVARCGEPASRTLRYADRIERKGGIARLRVIRREQWVYQPPAGRQPRLLTFIDGVLARVELLDR